MIKTETPERRTAAQAAIPGIEKPATCFSFHGLDDALKQTIFIRRNRTPKMIDQKNESP